MTEIFNKYKIQFKKINDDKAKIHARVIGVIGNMIGIRNIDYNKYNLNNYFTTNNKYINEILTTFILNINTEIAKIKQTANSDLFNAIYINDLENEIEGLNKIITAWLLNISKITT
jgi:hypothetical protein